MKPADRFRVLETLRFLAGERVRVSIQHGELMMTHSVGEVGKLAKSLCRELAEAYEEHPSEVGEMITARLAA